jgi:hypothetical protein
VPVYFSGVVNCSFDNQAVPGHYVQPSSNNGGYCADAGSTLPTSGVILGIALSYNGAQSLGAPFSVPILLLGTR